MPEPINLIPHIVVAGSQAGPPGTQAASPPEGGARFGDLLAAEQQKLEQIQPALRQKTEAPPPLPTPEPLESAAAPTPKGPPGQKPEEQAKTQGTQFIHFEPARLAEAQPATENGVPQPEQNTEDPFTSDVKPEVSKDFDSAMALNAAAAMVSLPTSQPAPQQEAATGQEKLETVSTNPQQEAKAVSGRSASEKTADLPRSVAHFDVELKSAGEPNSAESVEKNTTLPEEQIGQLTAQKMPAQNQSTAGHPPLTAAEALQPAQSSVENATLPTRKTGMQMASDENLNNASVQAEKTKYSRAQTSLPGQRITDADIATAKQVRSPWHPEKPVESAQQASQKFAAPVQSEPLAMGDLAQDVVTTTAFQAPAPADPDPVELKPVQVESTQTSASPAVTAPQPADPDPVELKPVQVESTQTSASQAVTAPRPADPDPVELKPVQVESTQTSAGPAVTAPRPADPDPVELKPVQVESTDDSSRPATTLPQAPAPASPDPVEFSPALVVDEPAGDAKKVDAKRAAPSTPDGTVKATGMQTDIKTNSPSSVQPGQNAALDDKVIEINTGKETRLPESTRLVATRNSAYQESSTLTTDGINQITSTPSKSLEGKKNNDSVEKTPVDQNPRIQASTNSNRVEEVSAVLSDPAAKNIAEFSTKAQSLSEPARLAEARTAQLIDEISKQTELFQQQNRENLRILINPRELGRIDLRLVRTEDGIKVQILADRPATNQLLSDSLNQLQTSLSDAGIQLAGLQVGSHGSHGQPGWQPPLPTAQFQQRSSTPSETEKSPERTNQKSKHHNNHKIDYRI